MNGLVIFAAAYLMDLCFGDPYWMPHIVRLIGRLIVLAEKLFRTVFPRSKKGELAAGIFFACFVVGAVWILGAGLVWLADLLHPLLGFAVRLFLGYQLFAVKALKTESEKVYKKLEESDLNGARKAVARIVGRDTEILTEEGVARAAVETVAENTSDGAVAPMIFTACFGVLGGLVYKTVNTMDSMVGYRNEKYLYFGRAAAKLDDFLNFFPARISGVLMIAAAFILQMDYKNGWRIFLRDRKKHDSPNSAQTEAACAGILGVALAGDAWYFGRLHKKEKIGDPIRPIQYEDIQLANRLLYATTLLCAVGAGAVKLAVWFLQ